MYPSQQETNKTTAKQPEAENDNSESGLNYAEMLHEQSKCFQHQCSHNIEAGDAIQKKDDDDKTSGFNPKDFTWTTNAENLALTDISAILRKMFGIGLNFESNEKFAEYLKEKNKRKTII